MSCDIYMHDEVKCRSDTYFKRCMTHVYYTLFSVYNY